MLLNENGCMVVIPLHDKELKEGTLHAILNQAGLTKDDIRKYKWALFVQQSLLLKGDLVTLKLHISYSKGNSEEAQYHKSAHGRQAEYRSRHHRGKADRHPKIQEVVQHKYRYKAQYAVRNYSEEKL